LGQRRSGRKLPWRAQAVITLDSELVSNVEARITEVRVIERI